MASVQPENDNSSEKDIYLCIHIPNHSPNLFHAQFKVNTNKKVINFRIDNHVSLTTEDINLLNNQPTYDYDIKKPPPPTLPQNFMTATPVKFNGKITGLNNFPNGKTDFYCYIDNNNTLISKIITYVNNGIETTYDNVKYVYSLTKNPCCFNEGTKILCLTKYLMEEYRLVQDLIVGDLVKAYMNDYKPIKNIIQGFFINNPKNRSNCMYIMKKTENNGLIEDLIVTGNHGILLDEKDVNEEEQKKNPEWANFKVDDKVNCITGVSSKFEQITDNELYKYYHFSLDNGDGKRKRFGVWANGVLMETMP